MNPLLILKGGIEILISLITGFLVFFLSLKIFMLLTRSLDEDKELKNNNTAVAVVLAGFVLALILIVNSAVSPSMDTFMTFFSDAEGIELGAILIAVLRIIITYLVSSLVGLFILWLAISLYTGLTTKIDEMAELKNNNLAVGIVFAAFVFSAGMLTKEPLTNLLNAFVAPPKLSYVLVESEFINLDTLLEGLLELSLSFLGTIVVFIFGVKLSDLFTLKIKEVEEIKNKNVAAAIYLASIILSIMLVVQSTISPAYQVLHRALSGSPKSVEEILGALIIIISFLLASALISFLLIKLALFVFMIFTRKIDEIAELKRNNVAVALLLAVVTFSIAILVQNGMKIMLEGFVLPAQQMSSIPILKVK